jgi:serine/threonine protein phosphatase PrpC
MLDVAFGQASDSGRVRPHNEDAAAAFIPKSRDESRSRGWLFAVADGVGGRDLGEVASAKAIEIMVDGFARSQEGTSLPGLLPRLIQYANAAIHDEGLAPERRGRHMATTVVCCALRHDVAFVAHVGDSRCYQVRDGSATLLTRDHTWVTEQRRLGLMTAAAAEQSEKRHVLTRSLGPELFVTVDTGSVSLKPGDVLVLCTDGLYGAMYTEDIARIASQDKDAATIAQELVSYAVEVDGADNATAQVIQVRATEPMGMYRGRLYTLPLPPTE